MFKHKQSIKNKLVSLNQEGLIIVTKYEGSLVSKYTEDYLIDISLTAIKERYGDTYLKGVGYIVTLRYDLKVKSVVELSTANYTTLRKQFK